MKFQAKREYELEDKGGALFEGADDICDWTAGSGFGDLWNVYADGKLILKLEYSYNSWEKHIDEEPSRHDYVRLLLAEYSVKPWQGVREIDVDEVIVEAAGMRG